MSRTLEQTFFATLNEKQKRLFAGLKANELGYLGVRQVAQRLGVHPHTIRAAQKELAQSATVTEPSRRIRKAGGGRKKARDPSAEQGGLCSNRGHLAGTSPMNDHVWWTNLRVAKFVQAFAAQGRTTSRFLVRQVTRAHGLGQRQRSKKLTIKEVTHREEQFEKIAALQATFRAQGLPVLSVDTKKKEFIGQL